MGVEDVVRSGMQRVAAEAQLTRRGGLQGKACQRVERASVDAPARSSGGSLRLGVWEGAGGIDAGGMTAGLKLQWMKASGSSKLGG